MIIVEANNNINIRWRDQKGVRQTSLNTNYKPYFYIETGSDTPEVIQVNGRFGVNRIRPTYTFGDWENIDGQSL